MNKKYLGQSIGILLLGILLGWVAGTLWDNFNAYTVSFIDGNRTGQYNFEFPKGKTDDFLTGQSKVSNCQIADQTWVLLSRNGGNIRTLTFCGRLVNANSGQTTFK